MNKMGQDKFFLNLFFSNITPNNTKQCSVRVQRSNTLLELLEMVLSKLQENHQGPHKSLNSLRKTAGKSVTDSGYTYVTL